MHQTLRTRALPAAAGAAVTLVLVVTVSHSLTSSAPVYPVEDFSADAAFAVTRILSGDAVEVDSAGIRESIHLAGVDDQGARAREASEGEAPDNAARLTRDLLLGEAVYLRRLPSVGRVNGRSVAYVYRAPDGLFVNLELVRQGYASSDTEVGHPHAALFTTYERRARAAARGLWGADVHRPDSHNVTPSPASRPARTPPRASADASRVTVYITKTGSKYHTANCRFVKRSKMPSTLAAARVKLGPCSHCNPPR